MKRDYHRWYSERLNREMGVVVYGHWGPPTIVFPTSGGDEWEFQLGLLQKLGGFRRSVTMKPALDFVEKTLAGDRNVWTQYIGKWKLASTQPWVSAARPNADMTRVAQEERNARVAAEVARLKQGMD